MELVLAFKGILVIVLLINAICNTIFYIAVKRANKSLGKARQERDPREKELGGLLEELRKDREPFQKRLDELLEQVREDRAALEKELDQSLAKERNECDNNSKPVGD